jgi:hypothetical protein
LQAPRRMNRLLRAALCGAAAVSLGAGAASKDDDGFIWIDANTRIKLAKPVSAASGATKAAQEPKKEKKQEKTKK